MNITTMAETRKRLELRSKMLTMIKKKHKTAQVSTGVGVSYYDNNHFHEIYYSFELEGWVVYRAKGDTVKNHKCYPGSMHITEKKLFYMLEEVSI